MRGVPADAGGYDVWQAQRSASERSLLKQSHSRAFPANLGSVLFLDWRVRSGGEPVAARCPTSGKTGSPSGVRQSETRPRRLPSANAQRRFRRSSFLLRRCRSRATGRPGDFASISAQSRSTVSSDMLFASLLDLAAKSLRQNDSQLTGNALAEAADRRGRRNAGYAPRRIECRQGAYKGDPPDGFGDDPECQIGLQQAGGHPQP